LHTIQHKCRSLVTHAVTGLLWPVDAAVQLCIVLEGPAPAAEMVRSHVPATRARQAHNAQIRFELMLLLIPQLTRSNSRLSSSPLASDERGHEIILLQVVCNQLLCNIRVHARFARQVRLYDLEA
jgi:hypothetical protein